LPYLISKGFAFIVLHSLFELPDRVLPVCTAGKKDFCFFEVLKLTKYDNEPQNYTQGEGNWIENQLLNLTPLEINYKGMICFHF